MPPSRRATVPDSYTRRPGESAEEIIEIAVLASGSGTNLQALLDTPDLGARVVTVISDQPAAPALDRARQAGITTAVVEWGEHETREGFTKAICDIAESAGGEALILAGFMRILAPVAVRRFRHRILNVHPSLLPAFPGAHAVAQALAHGVKVTGVTVHFVDEEVDHGPIIAQRTVPVLPEDDERSLHSRIQVEEHDLYPRVIRSFAAGDIVIEGRRVTWT